MGFLVVPPRNDNMPKKPITSPDAVRGNPSFFKGREWGLLSDQFETLNKGNFLRIYPNDQLKKHVSAVTNVFVPAFGC